jgi:tRNA (cmo5U34)-methyltransferase
MSTPNPSPETAALFDDVAAAESRDALLAPLGPLKLALNMAMAAALAPLPSDAHLLLVGVGTGPELLALAQRHPGWRFTALDPAQAMLTICRRRAEAAGIQDRCRFHQGVVSSLPQDDTFDAATAITVSHFFLDPLARIQFFTDIALRLKPGGLFINADLATAPEPMQQGALLQMWTDMMQDILPEEFAQRILSSLGDKVALEPTPAVDGLMRRAGFRPAVRIFQTLLLNAWCCARAAP